MGLASNIYILWPLVVTLTTAVFLCLSHRQNNQGGRILQINRDAVFLALIILVMFFTMILTDRAQFFPGRSGEIVYLCVGAYIASKLGKALGNQNSLGD